MIGNAGIDYKELYLQMQSAVVALSKTLEEIQKENKNLKEENEHLSASCLKQKVKHQSHLVLSSFLFLMRQKQKQIQTKNNLFLKKLNSIKRKSIKGSWMINYLNCHISKLL